MSDVREELNALIDGELPAERAAELRARLETDAELRAEYETLKRTAAAVRALPSAGAPPELMERLRAERPAGRVVRPRWPLAAAAVVIVGVSAALFALRDRDEPEPQEYEAVHREEKPADKFDSVKRDDAPAEADDESEKGGLADAGERKQPEPEPAPGRALEKLGKKEQAESRRRESTIARLEGGAPLTAEQRAGYLRSLDGLPREKLVAHIATLPLVVAPSPRAKAGTKKRAARAPATTVPATLTNRAEAELVRKLVRRGYGTREAAARPSLDVQAADFIDVSVDLTESELLRLRSWLARLDVTPRRPGAPGIAVRAESKSTGKSDDTKRRPVRLRLRFPK